MPPTRKTEVESIDGTPEKRMFWSIISDYDLRTGLCELIDNAIDLWTKAPARGLNISVTLDSERQFISVRDNAGGVRHEDLRQLIAPGGSNNDPNAEVIGIFGVGGKRAGVALGERVEIKTRFKKQATYQLDVTREWLEQADWEIPAYTVPDIQPGTTIVDISRLIRPFSSDDVEEIRTHLGQTYAWFLHSNCILELNEDPVAPADFEDWAYPPGFPPQRVPLEILLGAERVSANITAGLIRNRDPEEENYGVYIYCNHRLIVKALRTRDVGYFVSREAGVPHSDASLCRAVVHLQGPAKLMPWNSSKNGINPNHPVFQRLRPTLISLVAYFSSLSRRLRHEWDAKVFPFDSGTVEDVQPEELAPGKRLNLPALPRVRKQQAERLKARNKKTLKDSPWTMGLIEAMAAVAIISRQRLDTKNRIALILLDSNFEISLKEFIVHRLDLFPPAIFNDAKIQETFKNRTAVVREVAQRIAIPPQLLDKARHYYNLRNKLIHERATVDVTNTDVENYRDTVEQVLRILFGIHLRA